MLNILFTLRISTFLGPHIIGIQTKTEVIEKNPFFLFFFFLL